MTIEKAIQQIVAAGKTAGFLAVEAGGAALPRNESPMVPRPMANLGRRWRLRIPEENCSAQHLSTTPAALPYDS